MAVDDAVCHSIKTFSMGGVFNHRVVDPAVQACATCHNGDNSINAIGMPDGHISSNGSDCAMCHTTRSFKGASFDHTDFVGSCSDGCHDGKHDDTGAIGKSVNHMPTSDDCHVCHTPGTFATGIYDHKDVISGCSACHNGIISAGKHDKHIPTTPDDQDCVDCHKRTSTFVGAVFEHTAITNGCATCHDGNISTGKGKGKNHMPTIPDYSACHRNKFKGKDKHIGGKSGTVFQNRDCSGGGSGCHKVSSSGFD